MHVYVYVYVYVHVYVYVGLCVLCVRSCDLCEIGFLSALLVPWFTQVQIHVHV